MTTPMASPNETVREYERRAEEAEQSPVPVLLKIARGVVWVIWVIVVIEAVILTLAFLLRLFGANPDAGFAEWVYRSSERAMEPFRGIFPSHQLTDTSVFDASLLFGALVYLVIALLIDGILHWITHRLHEQQYKVTAARAAADNAARQLAQQQYIAQQSAAHDYAVAQAAAQQAVAAQQGPRPSGT